MAVRTFIALDLAESTLACLGKVQESLKESAGKVRWVSSKNMHVTLNFLGDVEADALADVVSHAATAAGMIEAFDFEVKGLTCVPPTGQLRMLWAQVIDPSGRMGDLYQALSSELAQLGFEPEKRKFKPHLTLCRVKRMGESHRFRIAADAYRDKSFGTQRAKEIVVYSSQLTPAGAVYAAMGRAELK